MQILDVKDVVWVVYMWFVVVWWWFGANMAGQRNKYAFKFLLHLLILSQKHILGVKKVVWDWFRGGLGWFGGGLGWFGGGLGLTWQVNVINMLSNFFFIY